MTVKKDFTWKVAAVIIILWIYLCESFHIYCQILQEVKNMKRFQRVVLWRQESMLKMARCTCVFRLVALRRRIPRMRQKKFIKFMRNIKDK